MQPRFLVVVGLLVLFWAPGIFLNDDAAQVLGLWALSEGEVVVSGEFPDDYQILMRGAFRHYSIPGPGEVGPPVGSSMLNALALPVWLVLSTVAEWTSAGIAIGVVTGALLFAAARVASEAGGPRCFARPWMPWATASLVVPGMFQSGPVSPGVEIASLQLVNLFATAATVALLASLLPRIGVRPTWAWLYLATPALFWSSHVKYHALSGFLVVLVVWLALAGARSHPVRLFAAGAVAGLAVWNQPPLGLLLLGVLGLRLLLEPRFIVSTSIPTALGTAVGLVPEILWRTMLKRAEVGSQFFAGGASGATVVQETSSLGLLAQTPLTAGWDWLVAVGRGFVWTDWWHYGAAIAVLPLVPFLALGLWTLLDGEHRTRWATLAPWSILYVSAALFMIGTYVRFNGAGFDLRHWFTLWPFLFLLAMPALQDAWDAHNRLIKERAAVAATLVVGAAVVVTMLWHRIEGSITGLGQMFEVSFLHRHLGLLAAAGLFFTAWPRLRAIGAQWVLPVALALPLTAQPLFLLTMGRMENAGTMQHVAWPVELLHQFLAWAFGY